MNYAIQHEQDCLSNGGYVINFFHGLESHSSAANQGIGYEVVRILAKLGHTVYLGARNAEKGQAAVYVHIILYFIINQYNF